MSKRSAPFAAATSAAVADGKSSAIKIDSIADVTRTVGDQPIVFPGGGRGFGLHA